MIAFIRLRLFVKTLPYPPPPAGELLKLLTCGWGRLNWFRPVRFSPLLPTTAVLLRVPAVNLNVFPGISPCQLNYSSAAVDVRGEHSEYPRDIGFVRFTHEMKRFHGGISRKPIVFDSTSTGRAGLAGLYCAGVYKKYIPRSLNTNENLYFAYL